MINKNIYLLGFMGSGKSFYGKKLAGKLNMGFIDLDKLIEQKTSMSINKIFEIKGEKEFRKLESEILKETFELNNTLVSLGGGTPAFFNNMELINKNGISVYIKMHPKSLVVRLLQSNNKRPLIQQLKRNEVFEYVEKKLLERETFYNQANITIKGEGLKTEMLKSYILTYLDNS